jgi:hypothetical protein
MDIINIQIKIGNESLDNDYLDDFDYESSNKYKNI